eukprot:7074295-Alexandrium_andersonii.AAC.1
MLAAHLGVPPEDIPCHNGMPLAIYQPGFEQYQLPDGHDDDDIDARLLLHEQGPITAKLRVMESLWRPRIAANLWSVFVPWQLRMEVMLITRWVRHQLERMQVHGDGCSVQLPVAAINFFVVGLIGNLMHILNGNGRDGWNWQDRRDQRGPPPDQSWGNGSSSGQNSGGGNFQEWMPRAYRGVKDKLEQAQEKLSRYEQQEQADKIGRMVQET